MENKNTSNERIKKLEEQIAKKKAELVREKGRISEKERKTRTRKLIQVGGLAEIAGLIESSPGFLLGVLMEASEISLDSERAKKLTSKGDALLKERESSRKIAQNKGAA